MLICLSVFVFTSSYSQDSELFERKGRVLVETGFSFLTVFGSGTGFSLISSEGENISSLGFDGGYFINQDFALKFGISNLSAGGSITSFQFGGKYYIGGVAPITITAGLISGEGGSAFLGNLNLGYGVKLANNINLEPYLGIVALEENYGNLNLGVRFSMFL